MQTYALGAIEPNAGLIHELNIITNQRLDNLELAIDSMWTIRQDGLLQPNEVFTEPGKVFVVADHNDIEPLPHGSKDFSVTYQESGVLEQFIDKNFGTGALIGGGQPRGGERVTAEEIQAVRDAGGNRLSNIHKHIEDTALLPLLNKVMRLMQQFVEQDELVKVANGDETSDYYTVGQDELNQEWTLKPLGADYVADRKHYVQQRLDFLQAVIQVPQMAQKLNYDAILHDLVHHFGFDEPDRYIVDGTPSPAPSPEEAGMGQPTDPNAIPPAPAGDPAQSDIASKLHELGGKPLQQAVMNDLQGGGADQVISKYFGAQTPQL
jgi:hypothetical protein